jgi:hypothetical protein
MRRPFTYKNRRGGGRSSHPKAAHYSMGPVWKGVWGRRKVLLPRLPLDTNSELEELELMKTPAEVADSLSVLTVVKRTR